MKNKIFSFFIIFTCSLFTCFFANAESDVVVSLQIDNPVMEINGIETEIDNGRGTKPIINQGRTLVPIRAIIEAFGGNVMWDDNTKTVCLSTADDVIKLVIDSKTAYLNNNIHTLDVAPTVVNGRTMLPIRFIAESFNFGVAWDSDKKTVWIIKNSFDSEEYARLVNEIPEYSGEAFVEINNNIPFFEEYEMITGSFEYYSNLDELGRCNVCMASVSTDLMPEGERESISSIHPTGWKSVTYDFIPGKYLYNRCHLIGYQLTGENANSKNLITGTRYLNIDGMLPFENIVAEYVEETGKHVIYRVTPVFEGDNLVADGVLMEGYSVEDMGEDVAFCVFCYNVQPGVFIDYLTGDNKTEKSSEIIDDYEYIDIKVYRTPTGKKYHYNIQCGGKNSFEISYEQAIADKLTPCMKCAK